MLYKERNWQLQKFVVHFANFSRKFSVARRNARQFILEKLKRKRERENYLRMKLRIKVGMNRALQWLEKVM